jgi:hypothetical protein
MEANNFEISIVFPHPAGPVTNTLPPDLSSNPKADSNAFTMRISKAEE